MEYLRVPGFNVSNALTTEVIPSVHQCGACGRSYDPSYNTVCPHCRADNPYK